MYNTGLNTIYIIHQNKKMKEFWNERYSQSEFAYGETPNEYLKEKLKSIPTGKILFACEGEGRNAVYASKLGWKSFAFDQSQEGKNKAELLALKKDVEMEYLVSDVENIDYPSEYFDALVLVYAHFPEAKRKEYHQKLASSLKKNGSLIIEGFSKQHFDYQMKNPNIGGPKDINMLYDLSELKSDFEGFDFIESCQTETELNEGIYHIGQASVIRILALKK